MDATAALRRIYAAADRDVARRPELACALSGRCCRFREAGHRLFLTRLEYDEMVRRGGPPRRPADGICPWLEGGLCANREGRALACRTYFCSDEAAAAAVTETWHRRIRALHADSGVRYEYGPLEHFVDPKDVNPEAAISSNEP